jgi:hypothetical protein
MMRPRMKNTIARGEGTKERAVPIAHQRGVVEAATPHFGRPSFCEEGL